MAEYLISKYGGPYIVMEGGATHNGQKSAMNMIRDVFTIGHPLQCVDAWKWQTHSSEDLVGEDYQIEFTDASGTRKQSVKALLGQREMPDKDWAALFAYAYEKGFDCFSTPDTLQVVGKLVEWGANCIKISGSDMTYYPLIEAAAKTGLPVLLDARCTWKELLKAIGICATSGNKRVVVVYCPSGYPAKVENVSLGAIAYYKRLLPECQIGYSDHSIGQGVALAMCAAAVALGATYIEKNYSNDVSALGIEHIMSLDRTTLWGFAQTLKDVAGALRYEPIEHVNQMNRRGLFANRDLNVGEQITLEDLAYKRPGDALPAEEADKLVMAGATVHKAAKRGEKLTWAHFGMEV